MHTQGFFTMVFLSHASNMFPARTYIIAGTRTLTSSHDEFRLEDITIRCKYIRLPDDVFQIHNANVPFRERERERDPSCFQHSVRSCRPFLYNVPCLRYTGSPLSSSVNAFVYIAALQEGSSIYIERCNATSKATH
jgi:hypothetical protein